MHELAVTALYEVFVSGNVNECSNSSTPLARSRAQAKFKLPFTNSKSAITRPVGLLRSGGAQPLEETTILMLREYDTPPRRLVLLHKLTESLSVDLQPTPIAYISDVISIVYQRRY